MVPTFVWVIVRLFDERELFTLVLIETTLNGISLFEFFQSQNQELGVVLCHA